MTTLIDDDALITTMPKRQHIDRKASRAVPTTGDFRLQVVIVQHPTGQVCLCFHIKQDFTNFANAAVIAFKLALCGERTTNQTLR